MGDSKDYVILVSDDDNDNDDDENDKQTSDNSSTNSPSQKKGVKRKAHSSDEVEPPSKKSVIDVECSSSSTSSSESDDISIERISMVSNTGDIAVRNRQPNYNTMNQLATNTASAVLRPPFNLDPRFVNRPSLGRPSLVQQTQQMRPGFNTVPSIFPPPLAGMSLPSMTIGGVTIRPQILRPPRTPAMLPARHPTVRSLLRHVRSMPQPPQVRPDLVHMQTNAAGRPSIILPRPVQPQPPVNQQAFVLPQINHPLMKKRVLTDAEKCTPLNLIYSQVPCRAGDLLVAEKNLYFTEEPPGKPGAKLRPCAQFLEELGLSCVKHQYKNVFERMSATDKESLEKEEAAKKQKKRKPQGDDDEEYEPGSEEDAPASASVKPSGRGDECPNSCVRPASQNYWHNLMDTSSLPSVDNLMQCRKFRCCSCSFTADCELPVLLHYERGHADFSGLVRCAFCQVVSRDHGIFMMHMLAVHGLPGRPEPRLVPPERQCSVCPFELPGAEGYSGRLRKHMLTCLNKYFRETKQWLSPYKPQDGYIHFNFVFFSECMQRAFLHGQLRTFTLTPSSELLSRRYGLQMQPAPVPVSNGVSNGHQYTNTEMHKLHRSGVIGSRSLKKKPYPRSRLAKELLVCDLCNGMVVDVPAMRQHVQRAHGKNLQENWPNYNCKACGKSFWLLEGLKIHMSQGGSVVAGEPRCAFGRSCPLCKKPFLFENIYLHVAQVHPDQLELLLSTENCLVCQSDSRPLEEHLADCHSIYVNRVTDPDSGRVRYQFTNNKPSKQSKFPKKAPQFYECSQCSFTFGDWYRLRDHAIRLDHQLPCYRCRATNRNKPPRFVTARELAHHLNTVHLTDTELCALCGKKLRRGKSFMQHMQQCHLRKCSVSLRRIHVQEEPGATQETPIVLDDD